MVSKFTESECCEPKWRYGHDEESLRPNFSTDVVLNGYLYHRPQRSGEARTRDCHSLLVCSLREDVFHNCVFLHRTGGNRAVKNCDGTGCSESAMFLGVPTEVQKPATCRSAEGACAVFTSARFLFLQSNILTLSYRARTARKS